MKNNIFNMDCVKGLKELIKDESIDLTVTSPPYDNLRSKYYESLFDCEELAKELWRVSKQGASILWVVSDQTIKGGETLTSFKQALTFQKVGFNVETIIWQKANPLPEMNHNRYTQAFEYIFCFTKGRTKVFNPLTEPAIGAGKTVYKSFGRTHRDGKFKDDKVKKYTVKSQKILSNVWKINNTLPAKNGLNHPARFPIEIPRRCIRTWSNPCDLILDPFMGSGTTAVAARELGRNYVGFEIEKKYCDIIEARLAEPHQATLLECENLNLAS